MLTGDVADSIWKIIAPYTIGSLVSMMSALILWIIKTFNRHSDQVKDIMYILVGTDGKNGIRSEVKKCNDTIDELKLDIARIQATLKID